MSVCLSPGCTDGEVRLVGGANAQEGRVEVCIDGQWGSVCNDQWNDYAAKSVCRQLGYPIAGQYKLHTVIFRLLAMLKRKA